jgi:hypothetical protein
MMMGVAWGLSMKRSPELMSENANEHAGPQSKAKEAYSFSVKLISRDVNFRGFSLCLIHDAQTPLCLRFACF